MLDLVFDIFLSRFFPPVYFNEVCKTHGNTCYGYAVVETLDPHNIHCWIRKTEIQVNRYYHFQT